MKLRKAKKYIYNLYGSDDYLKFKFKRKADLLKHVTNNIDEFLYCYVVMDYKTPNRSFSHRQWYVNYDKRSNKIKLTQVPFRGKKHIRSTKSNLNREDKLYFAFSNKRINKMLEIHDKGLTKERALQLMKILKKSGYESLEITDENRGCVHFYIEKGIDFYHWCDRLYQDRAVAVIEYFKRLNYL